MSGVAASITLPTDVSFNLLACLCIPENCYPSVFFLFSRSERSRVVPWPGTLCCVLGQDTLLSQCLSSPRCINGYR